jgi:hypothetical protein
MIDDQISIDHAANLLCLRREELIEALEKDEQSDAWDRKDARRGNTANAGRKDEHLQGSI